MTPAKTKLIACGGFGSEANVDVELRTEFPGIGGKIFTSQAVITALREEFSADFKLGHKMFLKHTIIKKLDDYFQRKGFYQFPHIPRPIGSISRQGTEKYEAYIYEWVLGVEGFPWELANPKNGITVLKMIDWNEFCGAFNKAGIDLSVDCADADDGRYSKNIIHQFFRDENNEINPLWQRIDFGQRSVRIDYEMLKRFMRDNKNDMLAVLGSERYDMIYLALEYLIDFLEMDRLDIGRLDTLVGLYRLATLKHFISMRTEVLEKNALAYIGSREQFLT